MVTHCYYQYSGNIFSTVGSTTCIKASATSTQGSAACTLCSASSDMFRALLLDIWALLVVIIFRALFLVFRALLQCYQHSGLCCLLLVVRELLILRALLLICWTSVSPFWRSDSEDIKFFKIGNIYLCLQMIEY